MRLIPKGDLISREALRKALQNREECKKCTDIDCISCFYELIDNAPTVKTYTEEDLKKKYDEGVNAGYAICYDRYIRKNNEPFS